MVYVIAGSETTISEGKNQIDNWSISTVTSTKMALELMYVAGAQAINCPIGRA